MNKNSEDAVNQLRVMFESEKINFEEKLKEEKKKNERKIKNLTEDYESKIQEMENEMNEEIDMFNNDLQEKDNYHETYCRQVEHEINTLNQRIDMLESNLKEAKELNLTLQNNHATLLEQQLENHNKERKELADRIEKMNQEFGSKENELTTLRLKRDQNEKLLSEKDKILLQSRTDHDEERKDLEKKIENYKVK